MEISGEVVTELAEALDERVRKLARIARHNVDYGLSLTSATVLARLNEAGPQRVTDLAALELVAQPTMTTLGGTTGGTRLRRAQARRAPTSAS